MLVCPVCMTSKVLSVLIIGGENSAEIYSGCSASSGSRGYVPQLVRQLQQVGWQVQIECHTPVDIDVALPLLQQLNLNRFDLILLELGHAQLQQPAIFNELLRPSAYGSFTQNAKPITIKDMATKCSHDHTEQQSSNKTLINKLLSQSKLGILQLLASVGRVGRLLEIKAQLTDLLYYMQPYRRRLVLLTPLPHPHPVSNWLRKRGQGLFSQHGRRHMIPVFDTATVIGRGEEFFADSDQGYLSPVAGDLLGQTLFDYIQSNALLPARPELRQRRGY